MVKSCDHSICQSYLESGKFHREWKKKTKVGPDHKKVDKQILRNYRPILLLPITEKILERLLCDRMLEVFEEIYLISDDQSDFRPGDSCIGHLLSVTH